LYLNGEYVGYTRSSRTQQRVDVTPFLKPDAKNLIAVKICDLPRVRLDGLYEWQELSLIWSGIYRPISLEITDSISIIDVYTQPKLTSKSVHVTAELSQAPAESMTVEFAVKDGDMCLGNTKVNVAAGQTKLETDVKLADFTTWSPNHPQLYTLDTSLLKGNKQTDKVPMRFGMREIFTTHNKFYLNGKPIYVRCFGDMSLYPDTLAPSPDKEWYLPKLKRAQAYGFNMAKSCVEVFSQDFVEAADEAGVMIIQEFPLGVGPVLRANRNTIDKEFRDYFTTEAEGMTKETRNNASVVA
jgi:beta-glucuronidase